MLAGARVDVAPYQRDPMDFVLWKPSQADEPGWPSPSGIARAGRPGWHIECSAMSMATLLRPFGGGLACDDPTTNTFDIHGGGIDLVFPHHENEIAQSCCAFGAARMANIWMHNGFLQVEGEKMSKSLGNFITVHDLLRTDRFGGRAWPGATLRLAMLRTHYRQPIDWTVRGLEESHKSVERFARIASRAPAAAPTPSPELLAALGDDLNTPAALAHLHALAQNPDAAAQLWRDVDFLGVDLSEAIGALAAGSRLDAEDRARIEALVARRLAARRARDWATADRLRDDLEGFGVTLEDSKDGTTWEMRR
jgi:cysteinyl-tRNA synthetase